jgi:hypothetical protein
MNLVPLATKTDDTYDEVEYVERAGPREGSIRPLAALCLQYVRRDTLVLLTRAQMDVTALTGRSPQGSRRLATEFGCSRSG